MRTDAQTITSLKDYRPSDFLVDTIELDIHLHQSATRVVTRTRLKPNPLGRAGAALVMDGDELVVLGMLLNGQALAAETFEATAQGLTLFTPPAEPFELTIVTEVDPTANTKLMGLYRSSGIYCTQCEADGFRRITYALDRPDVLAVYTTRIEADRDEAPMLLGNGNEIERGNVPGTGRHFAVWHDPFPKPAYLFAVVGGRLGRIAKPFVTASGHPVELAVLVEPGKEERAVYALDALERSMRWDERVYGREYDLDVFNVVAVSDFNMGAMENKGLNIFNDKYVLASAETATDGDYAGIETVIAHEYFHNWTGNRITCRDWFQLCLKEGLTVFRDQEFSSDERSRAVHRIGEVRTLRARQFSEDAGPLAHPVRPKQYREINNFYTATVYEKGAEIVRMLKTLIGTDAFARGMQLYFERCDGTAATVEDFLKAFADSSGVDLGHFALWYEQAGTPAVAVATEHDPATGTLTLRFKQTTPPTAGETGKKPLVVPIVLGLVGVDGQSIAMRNERIRDDGMFVLDRAADELTLAGLPSRCVPSLLRGFSAPVRLVLDLSDDDLLVLARNDPDPFNRWQAAQDVATRILLRLVRAPGTERDAIDAFSTALDSGLGTASADPAFAALLLALPGSGEIAQAIGANVDPDAVHQARETMRRTLGATLARTLKSLWITPASSGPYRPDAASAGRRALRNAALDLYAMGDETEGERLAQTQFGAATNMTDKLAALAVLTTLGGPAREKALAQFVAQYRDEPLVLDKWFALQASIPEPGTLARVRDLMAHPAFSLGNPNRVRSLVGGFALYNPTQFHSPDGAGYDFVVDVVLGLNASNPQIGARLLTAFGSWRMMEAGRRAQAERALRRVAESPALSPDVADIVQRSLSPVGPGEP